MSLKVLGSCRILLKTRQLVPILCAQRNYGGFPSRTSSVVNFLPNAQQVRSKYVKGKRGEDAKNYEEDEVDDDFEDKIQDKHTKVMRVGVNSMRADLILKSGLGLARNKVEALFYESKIRVNGKKLQKKSAQVFIGDELDVIKSVSPTNPDHLLIQRVEVLGVTQKEDQEGLSVQLRRCKSLIIENYDESPYKGGSSES